jgi:Sap, sulfolipid-1-addressing protein
VSLNLFLIALAIALEPIPLTGYILLLSSERGVPKGLGFLFGWIVTLVALVAITLAVTGGKPPKPSTAPSTGILAAKILIGAALLLFAWHYRHRPAKPPSTPKWMKRIDSMGFGAAIVLGFLLQPWGLIAAGAAEITSLNLSKSASFIEAVLFCILATSSYLAMQTYALVKPEAALARLGSLRIWLETHRSQVITWISVVVGLWLIGQSAYLLAS